MSTSTVSPADKSLNSRQETFEVIMLTTAHSAVDPRIFHREARTLVQAGMSVCVIGKHFKSEYLEGIWIEALPTAPNRLRRFFMGWMLLKRAWQFRGKLYIFHDPELFGVGLILRLLGRKVLYDCHENVPMQVLQKAWIPQPLRWILAPLVGYIEWLGSRLLSGVLVVNDTLGKRFPERRTLVVRNLLPANVLSTIGRGPPVSERNNVVIYTGGLSRIRGIAELVEAFKGLEGNAELWLVGHFADTDRAFEKQILSSLPRNVRWFGWKEYSEVLELYQSAKIGAVLLYPTPNHRNAMPVKLWEYLGAGLPVIASDMPEYTELVQGCGIQVNPRDVAQIRVAIQRLLSNKSALQSMSKAGRERTMNFFCWENDGRKLVAFCSQLTST
jgi:glycosyltransferase involved in cell wall biosynthesis